jgi:predicted  nucleic acid-binding Zn-ribbon protein
MQVDWDTLLSVVILIAIALVIFRGGSKNPVGTGQLQSQLNTIGSKIVRIEAKLADTCSAADLEQLRGEIQQIESGTASSVELVALQGELHVVGEKVNGWGEATRRIEKMVDRMHDHFIQKGM